ncbi:MAG: exo-alpha-sialidase [archaeon]|nr:exo-alpha-sialidase [archaeon]
MATQASSISSEESFKPFSGFIEQYFKARNLDPSLSTLTLDIRVWKSTDGGLTFSPSVVVANGSRSVLNDKPWIAVDPSDPDNVYVSWTRFTFRADKVYARIVLSRSTDGGQTWSEPISISPEFDISIRVVQGSMPAIGPDGTVYVAYYDSLDDGWLSGYFSPMIAKSTDGGSTFSSPVAIATMLEIDYDLPPTVFRAWSSMLPIIAVDPIDSDYVYAVFTTYDPIFAEDIYFSRSDDGGETWDLPIWVNDDTTPNSQFFPSVTVTPDRKIHIIWGDRRDDPDNYLYNIYYDSVPFTGPFDPGLGTDEKISTMPSDPTIQNPYYIGDYFDVAPTSTNQIFAVWTDMRNDGDQDIYIAESPDFDNIRVNQDPITRLGFSMQNDPTIAVNPEDPDNIVVGAHDSRDRPYEAWYYTSIDGGETWIEGSLPSINSIYLLSDPSLAFGLDDTVYYATIATEPVDLNITPDSGPIGTNIEIEATGFDPFSTVLIMFDDENLGFKITNAVGSVEATIQAPSSQPGTHVIKVIYVYVDGYVWAEESFNLIDTTPIIIDVEAGSNLFRGETAKLYARTTLNGQPVNVTSINSNLYLPDGTITALTVQHISTGLYVASYTIPSNAPFGTYLMVFDAQITDSTVQTTGSSTSSFIISEWMDNLKFLVIFQYLVIIIATIAVIASLVIVYHALKHAKQD